VEYEEAPGLQGAVVGSIEKHKQKSTASSPQKGTRNPGYSLHKF